MFVNLLIFVLNDSLEKSIHAFRESEFVKSTFGHELTKHYTKFFEMELDAYETAVSDWERKRYFEQI